MLDCPRRGFAAHERREAIGLAIVETRFHRQPTDLVRPLLDKCTSKRKVVKTRLDRCDGFPTVTTMLFPVAGARPLIADALPFGPQLMHPFAAAKNWHRHLTVQKKKFVY